MDDEDPDEADPIRLMLAWLPPNTTEPRPTMTLSTLTDDGYPDARTVLLSQADTSGVYFHTDLRSRKARQLSVLPRACAVLVWPEVGRQLVILGDVEPAPSAEVTAVYRARGRYLQLLAWLNTRELAQLPKADRRSRWAVFAAAHPEGTLEPPPTWAGFRLRPQRLTFYQADDEGPSNRTEYRRRGSGWTIALLEG